MDEIVAGTRVVILDMFAYDYHNEKDDSLIRYIGENGTVYEVFEDGDMAVELGDGEFVRCRPGDCAAIK